MEEKKKSNAGLIIFICILLLACGSMGTFIFMNKDKLFVKENTDVTADNNKKDKADSEAKEVKVYEITDQKISNLIDQLIIGNMSCDTLEQFANDRKVVASDVSADRAYDIAVFNKNSNISGTISLEELTKIIQKYLGKDYNFEVDKLRQTKGTCISHYYDSASKTVIPQETACGGTCGPHTSYKIVKAVDTDGVLEIDIKVLFVDKNITGFYSDYNKTQLVSGFNNNELEYEKGTTYKFIFKEEDGNYVFVSSEPVQ